MSSQYVYQHLRSVQQRPKDPDKFINPFKSMIYFTQGNRGSGKSSLDEVIAEENFNSGHTIVDLHSADNYESLYWAITHNCKKFWEQRKLETEEKQEPHCTCFKRYPIILVIPDYVQIDQEALDDPRVNHKYYTKQEWLQLGNFEWNRHWETDTNMKHIIQRPDYYEWIKVKKLPIPNKGFKNKIEFVTDLTNIMLQAKDERRIVVFNPVFYKDVNHKLVTTEQVLRELPDIVRSHFKPNTPETVAHGRGVKQPIPFEQWTTIEKNKHRVTLVMREFGSLVSAQLNEEKNQVVVKKAVFRLIKIIRQYRMSLVADFQRHNDVFAGVRDQRDVFIWRETNPDMFPEEYEWLKKDIDERRIKLSERLGYAFAEKAFPRIEDLGKNQMYVLYPKKNENKKRYKLFTARLPYFHHHQEDDDFELETGIIKETPTRAGTWRFVTHDEDTGRLVASEKDRIHEDKKVREVERQKLFDTVNALKNPKDKTKKMTSKEIFDHLKEIHMIPDEWSNESALRKFMSTYGKSLVKIPEG